MILDTLDNAARRAAGHPAVAEAIAFLRRADLGGLGPGRLEIAGKSLYATVAEGPGRGRGEGRLEAHERYADVHLLLGGVEELGWKPRAACSRPAGPYDTGGDVLFFDDEPEAWLALTPGRIAVFFPEDAHLPMVSEGKVRKIVAKALLSAPGRVTEAETDPRFPGRWSPRALGGTVTRDQVRSLLEAARWAPSCFNEQPWFFAWAVEEGPRRRFCDCLSSKNRLWACRAPLLMFAASRRNFARNGKPNRHLGFDAGAAWMSLALQARSLGLFAHAMAGFDPEAAHAVTGLPRGDFEIFAAVAVGVRGGPGDLPEDLRDPESPSSRKPLSEIGGEA